jgi:hypothetical protein
MSLTSRQTDHALLVAPLRDDMPGIEADMAALGHEILTIETARSPERAKMLQGKGSSKNGARSLHCFKRKDGTAESYAVDIGNARGVGKPGSKRAGRIDWWSDWVKDTKTGLVVKTKFFGDLETVVIRRGWYRILSAGVEHNADNDKSESWDAPHVQAIPVRLQNRFRALDSDDRLKALLTLRAK